jgi:hypothetical protein
VGARQEQRKRHHRSRKPCRKGFFFFYNTESGSNWNQSMRSLARSRSKENSQQRLGHEGNRGHNGTAAARTRQQHSVAFQSAGSGRGVGIRRRNRGRQGGGPIPIGTGARRWRLHVVEGQRAEQRPDLDQQRQQHSRLIRRAQSRTGQKKTAEDQAGSRRQSWIERRTGDGRPKSGGRTRSEEHGKKIGSEGTSCGVQEP